jgi:mRNA-decapping enzyme subunit 2
MEFETPPPATVDEALADLSVRFLANLPVDEPPTVERLFFQIQQAHWYYLDFVVSDSGGTEDLPHLNTFEFTRLLFERCPLLQHYSDRFAGFMTQFKEYTWQIPTFGCILLNAALTHVVLVRSFKGKSWGFPKGKVNQHEPHADCAAREVREETGADVRGIIREDEFLSVQQGAHFQKLFIVSGVPEDTAFAPEARKEISEIRWFSVDSIPCLTGEKGANRFWQLRDYLPRLRIWIQQQRRQAAAAAGGGGTVGSSKKARKRAARAAATEAASLTVPAKSGAGKPPKSSVRGAAASLDDLLSSALEDGLGGGGGGDAASKRWSTTEMFAANERLLGRAFEYDGNPHTFWDATRQQRELQARLQGEEDSKDEAAATAAALAALPVIGANVSDAEKRARLLALAEGASQRRAASDAAAIRAAPPPSQTSPTAAAAADERAATPQPDGLRVEGGASPPGTVQLKKRRGKAGTEAPAQLGSSGPSTAGAARDSTAGFRFDVAKIIAAMAL